MIIKLKRNQIDITKYDECVKNSKQYIIYGLSWYLDIVADTWEVLVFEDYKAVMPLPIIRAKRYLFTKKIIQPLLCQQLGVFSIQIQQDIEMLFYEKLVSLRPVLYQFNAQNNVRRANRQNYELVLKPSYDTLKTNYSKRRKRSVTQAKKYELNIIRGSSPISLIKIAKMYYDVEVYTPSFFKKLRILIKTTLLREKGQLIYVAKDGVLLGGGFFLKDNTRIINLFTAFSDIGKKYQAPSFLMNYLIEEYSDSNLTFDFEGSMIPSIASFFKSFGAKEHQYFQYRR